MGHEHLNLARLLDHFVGRSDVSADLAACDVCARNARSAEGLLRAGRAAVAATVPGARAMRRAMQIFRDEARPKVGLLKLVLDSLLTAAPALRATGTAHFLRFEGEATVELQVSPVARGIELRGQLVPAGLSGDVVAVMGKTRRVAKVASDGTFVLRGLKRGRWELAAGKVRIEHEF